MIKNLEEATVTFCDNGFMLAFAYTDGNDNYHNRRMVFVTAAEMYNYITKLSDAKKSYGNTSI